MENGDTAEGTALPFRDILLELGVHGLQERTDKWHFPCWPNDGAFVPDVADCWQFMSVTSARLGQFKYQGKPTLIVRDENGENGERDGPAARIGHGIDDIFKLGRDIDAAIFGARQRRGEACRVGIHCCWRERRLLLTEGGKLGKLRPSRRAELRKGDRLRGEGGSTRRRPMQGE